MSCLCCGREKKHTVEREAFTFSEEVGGLISSVNMFEKDLNVIKPLYETSHMAGLSYLDSSK